MKVALSIAVLLGFVALAVVAGPTATLGGGRGGATAIAAKSPKWIKGANAKWPTWGAKKLTWLRHEISEAKRDFADAKTEVTVVTEWSRAFVSHRVGAGDRKIRHRAKECKSFERLYNIRRENVRFHWKVHRALGRSQRRRRDGKFHNKVRSHLRKRYGKEKGSAVYNRHFGKEYEKWAASRRGFFTAFHNKYSDHARMFRTARKRVRAARSAFYRCRASVARLARRKVAVSLRARRIASAANRRSVRRLKRTSRILARIRRRIAGLKRRIAERVSRYKTHYFHRCRRVKGHKYRCIFSTVDGGAGAARHAFKFAKCFWDGARSAFVRYICYK